MWRGLGAVGLVGTEGSGVSLKTSRHAKRKSEAGQRLVGGAQQRSRRLKGKQPALQKAEEKTHK